MSCVYVCVCVLFIPFPISYACPQRRIAFFYKIIYQKFAWWISQKLLDNQFIVIQSMGSSPGLFATQDSWCPRGYMNIKVETTSYYTNPDGKPQEGLSGTGSPYPITIDRMRSYNTFPRVYLQGGTTFDITYYMASSFIGSPDTFTGASATFTFFG